MNNTTPHIIGITGLSAAGKTYTVLGLQKEFPEHILAISQDNYYQDKDKIGIDRWERAYYDNPQAFDNDILARNLELLRNNKPIKSFIYDFEKRDRIGTSQKIYPKPIILLEGLFILNIPILCDLVDMMVFLEAQADIRFCRRLIRDINERGLEENRIKEFIDQYLKYVKPTQEAFISPMKRYANIVINTDEGGKVAVGILDDYIKEIIKGNLSAVKIKENLVEFMKNRGG